ncbi:MAG: hypothetical protein ACUVXA_20710, partial [Candidatus Jordarchaeum sp.]|uniref:hypothetical protein n=1 Tax=Candidatus Jordarchaeum sp. TaxID=2823881 RepID=UPI004049E19D
RNKGVNNNIIKNKINRKGWCTCSKSTWLPKIRSFQTTHRLKCAPHLPHTSAKNDTTLAKTVLQLRRLKVFY